uniref:Amino acid transporter transmembrane domain-containing protein n=1 Tax=Zea mays TaxID=4577 RepID=A0A804U9R3_MAIZE
MATQARENHRHSFTTKDERSGEGAEDQAIDDWLPITSSRNAKWWYSAFHNVTAMVGAGVLSLPYAMSKLGWGPGIAVLMLSWVVTLYTMWQMVEMHEMVPGKRFDRYHELGQHAFGERLGLWIVVPQQLIVEVGGDIVFMVTGGRSLKKLHDVVVCDAAGRCSEGGGDIRLTYFIMIFASCHLLLSQLPNFNSISGDGVGEGVELHGGAGGRGVRVRGAQRGSGDPGHHPVHAGDPVQEAHVEGRRGRLRHGRRLLLPRLATRVLGLRQPGRRQRPRHAQQAPVAHRPRQRHGRRPCHWQLPDFRDAGVRHDGDGPGEETAFPARPCPPSHCPEHLCRVHDVHSHYHPLLRRAAWFLRRVRLCADNLFPSLRHVACNLQAQKVQSLMVRQLGLHCSWSGPDGPGANRSTPADHPVCQDVPILLVNKLATACSATAGCVSSVVVRTNQIEEDSLL